jgi:periplasmic protein TonB
MAQQGVVILRVRVATDGRILEAMVQTSSGYDSLDRAAVAQALRKWRFTPATENGAAVESWVRVPVRFELKRA